jgi:hypothetical protein
MGVGAGGHRLPGDDRGGRRFTDPPSPGANHHGVGLPTGQNSFLQHAWLPPDPPRGHGEHRYVFQVFALRAGEPFAEAPGRRALIDAILGRAIGVGCLIGTYERSVRQDVDTSLHESVGLIGGEAAGGLGTA